MICVSTTTRSCGRCCATGTYSNSKGCSRRPTKPGTGSPAIWTRPTGWPAGSRPNGCCGPPKPKSERHDLLTRLSGDPRLAGLALVRVADSGARGGGRVALDADAPQQPKRPRRAGRAAVVASGPDPQVAPQSAWVVSRLAFPAPQ